MCAFLTHIQGVIQPPYMYYQKAKGFKPHFYGRFIWQEHNDEF